MNETYDESPSNEDSSQLGQRVRAALILKNWIKNKVHLILAHMRMPGRGHPGSKTHLFFAVWFRLDDYDSLFSEKLGLLLKIPTTFPFTGWSRR